MPDFDAAPILTTKPETWQHWFLFTACACPAGRLVSFESVAMASGSMARPVGAILNRLRCTRCGTQPHTVEFWSNQGQSFQPDPVRVPVVWPEKKLASKVPPLGV